MPAVVLKGSNGHRNKLPFVVIAQQSAIPHYRVPFYQKLAEISAGSWDFAVVFDPDQQSRSLEHNTPINSDAFCFKTLPVKTHSWKVCGRTVTWQPFQKYLSGASLLITDTRMLNLSYPVAALCRPRTCKWVLWGHSRNLNLTGSEISKILPRFSSLLKRLYIRKADAFFAYTEKQKEDASKEERFNRVHLVNNTIDIQKQREIALAQKPQRDEIRNALDIRPDQFVFLFIGRLLQGRRVEFLLEALEQLHEEAPSACLVIIGNGNLSTLTGRQIPEYIKSYEGITDALELGRFCTAADAYVASGMIGLGPLQPLAHELPVIGFQLSTHGPEIDYLDNSNSILLPGETTSCEFAEFLLKFLLEPGPRWDEKRYNSVAHLTIDSMAANFDKAVRHILSLP